jgi:site-specific recombinase XerD
VEGGTGEPVAPESPLFRSERGGKLCTRAIRHLFKRCVARAGLDSRYGVHSLRHFHLSALYAKTNDLRLVQDQAEHSSVSVTQVYTHVSLKKRGEAVEGLF